MFRGRDLRMGYWRQRADERLGDPPPRHNLEPFLAKDEDGRPRSGPSGGALLLYIWRRCTVGGSGLWNVQLFVKSLSCHIVHFF